ncbi:Condensin complex subunit [Tulasnella sp. JGI-2019a]|nr:Condensin complex subunit [Tulasnella sp. JGI-2019a]KAG9004560.1 Condensin complex subunit [Tulasnella sp. JGI-2019a]
MVAQFSLQEDLQLIRDPSNYIVTNEVDCADEDAIATALEHAVEAVAVSPEAVLEPEVLDEYRSLLKHASSLSGANMSKLLDSITSGLQGEIDATTRDIDAGEQESFATHRQTLDVYAFLIHWFVLSADKASSKSSEEVPAKAKRGKGGGKAPKKTANRSTEVWSWSEHIPSTLAIISKLLRIKSHRIWMSQADRDVFINCVTRPAYHVMESEALMKDESIKMEVYKVICLAVKHHGHAFGAQTSIMQCLQYFEHLAEPMADVLTLLNDEFDHTQLTEGIIREIAGKTFNAQDTKGPRSFSRFLVRLTDLSPKLIRKQLSLLLAHIDSESYPIRMAMIEILGALIKEMATDEEAMANKEKQEGRINALFDLIFERFLDVNSYVRAKVLNTLSRLCDLQVKFPKQRQEMTTHVIAALQDKSSSVRRYAIALLTRLILTHPFGLLHGGPLNLTEWQGRYDVVKKELDEMEKGMGMRTPDREQEGDEVEGAGADDAKDKDEDEEMDEDNEETAGEDGEDENAEEEDAKMNGEDDDDEGGSQQKKEKGKKPPAIKKEKRQPRKSLPIDLAGAITEEQVFAALNAEKHVKLKLTKKYVADALAFIRQIEGAAPVLCQLLVSTSKAEVLESMEFFKTAEEYQLDCADLGIKKMLHLIWTKDNSSTGEDGKELKGIRSKLLEVYRGIYFDPVPDLEPKQQVNRIAKHMIEMTYGATLAELTSLEELMRTMMLDDQIHEDVINKLWHVYSVERDIPRCQRRGAIIILGMIAVAKKEVVSDRLDTLLRVGLGRFGKADLVLARFTCVALQRLGGSTKKVKGSLTDKSTRFPMEHPLFRKLQDAIEHRCRSTDWFGMAEQAINTIYLLGEQPEALCTALIRNLTIHVFRPKSSLGQLKPDGEDVDIEMADAEAAEEAAADKPEQQHEKEDKADTADSFNLSQLIFVVGHVAIKHIVYLEIVERDLKRRKDGGNQVADLGKGTKAAVEELDQVVGNAEDDIGEHIADVREREMLYGQNSILGAFGPLVVHICAQPKRYKDTILRTTATLTLSKLMCVSSRFCDENLLLLFKIFETSKDATIRSNIVIALGDVAVCFNNMIDENSNNLYEGLSDKDLNVKKNTLMVLTHLILNGMIKVKGQLGEMAKCLEDVDQRISDLAKLFFTELSTKDNAIYNNLPDVISHLSVGEHAVDQETFQSTMKYIFTFIEKEKQAESIVEKLCQRFRLTDEPRQWQDIAFCLSILPFKSERSVRKLIEGLPFYQDKLHDEEVFTRFNEILTKARSNKSPNKPDSELKEFETILQEYKEKGEEDQALEKNVKKKADQAKKRASKRSRRQRPASTPEEDDEE